MAQRSRRFHEFQRRMRQRRFVRIDALIRDILRKKECATILDAGGRGAYWEMLAPDLRERTRITCLNFEKELARHAATSSGLRVENVSGDACHMPQYADASFDLVHSNSVIEHVGSLGNMTRFAAEVRRVGVAYYVQTPNFWFPVEPHYAFPLIHWLPDQTRLWLYRNVSLGYAKKTDFAHALTRIDHVRMIGPSMLRTLFPDGRLHKERFALLPKSLTVIRDHAPGARTAAPQAGAEDRAAAPS